MSRFDGGRQGLGGVGARARRDGRARACPARSSAPSTTCSSASTCRASRSTRARSPRAPRSRWWPSCSARCSRGDAGGKPASASTRRRPGRLRPALSRARATAARGGASRSSRGRCGPRCPARGARCLDVDARRSRDVLLVGARGRRARPPAGSRRCRRRRCRGRRPQLDAGAAGGEQAADVVQQRELAGQRARSGRPRGERGAERRRDARRRCRWRRGSRGSGSASATAGSRPRRRGSASTS